MTIGVFDSGVGGLWILKHIKDVYPDYDYIFIGDQAHVPYGLKSMDEIRSFGEEVTNFLINKNCQIVVIACNTASSAALLYLRDKFPKTLFVGMEPAIKPAVESSKTGRVGVLATQATLRSDFYKSLVKKWKRTIELYEDSCLGLVTEIEKGDFKSKEVKNILNKALKPMKKKKIDTVVLGCTHYPFVIPEINKIVGSKVNVIDSTPAIVRQVGRMINLRSMSPRSPSSGKLEIFTTGDISKMESFLPKIMNDKLKVKGLNWDNNIKLSVIR